MKDRTTVLKGTKWPLGSRQVSPRLHFFHVAEFEVLTAVVMNVAIFCYIASCSLYLN
jgi:hypothetical protein